MDRGEVERILPTAYDFGRHHIDLSGCYYGKPFDKGPFVDWPLDYYYFLAGLVAELKCTRILEIGAHFGGSIFSMARGIECAGLMSSAEVVTVDVINRNPDGFKAVPLVKHILGSCFDPTKVRAAAESFSGPVDLLFVDIVHTYEQTKRCLDCYVPAVSPRFVILDDIRLNGSMARLWDELRASHGDRAIDVTHWARREEDVGFGLLISEAATASPPA
jgi:cephalosporin hydroxylase